ncbi:RNA polymerase sigma-70 factor [Pedobacter heparinus]|uniref:RNA polymerase sigma factor n=1 Tax=Pedobacter heparinus TaxID=984 RepID=UPI00292D84BE|nr:RNA polymerase sigma-70 factor [Pedobacter heparinus]
MAVYNTYTDQELTSLLKAGDHGAFSEIYNRYAVIMFYKVNQMLRDEETAKDMIQDLFIQLWAKSDLIKSDNNIAGYLYVSARHKVLKHLKKSKLKNEYLSSLALYVTEVNFDMLQDIDERELARVLQQEIDLLPYKMKVIFELSRRDDLSHAEIAAKLGISNQTVKKQIYNALKILRTKLTVYAPVALIVLELTKKG